ncbi:MAG: ECF-type RNA polymerase sigma 70 factor [Bacteroidetes bacterium HLUCCA01]|nr:MAG: ECF-type RNA polymerase sigma 70 factor [Bacteroidetes bacterium HLUCCA01]
MLLTELLVLFAMSASRLPEDAQRELTALIREGDARAFRTFFDQHHAALLQFLLSKNIRREVAEDLVQQAFLTIWDQRASLDASRSLRSFLFTIAYNRMLNHIRDHKAESVGLAFVPEEVDEGSPESATITSEAIKAMHRRLETMPERRREVFELCYLQELSHKEAAEAMGVSVKTIENHMAIALRELREALRGYME